MTDLLRGDVICVEWVDILEDPKGDPDLARLAVRKSYGLFWERRADPSGLPCFVTTTTLDSDDATQQGYCIYPEACIRSVKVIKRVRRKKAKVPQSEPI